MLFELGKLVATPAVLAAVPRSVIDLAVARHLSGDWGDMSDADKQTNEQALKDGGRLFSAYQVREDTRIWIITEADRSASTVLLPSDY